MFPTQDLNNKSSLTIKEMFSHQSGLSPWIPFYKKTIDSVTNKPLTRWYKSTMAKGFNIEVNDFYNILKDGKSYNITITDVMPSSNLKLENIFL